jgi:hypothetical protein
MSTLKDIQEVILDSWNQDIKSIKVNGKNHEHTLTDEKPVGRGLIIKIEPVQAGNHIEVQVEFTTAKGAGALSWL